MTNRNTSKHALAVLLSLLICTISPLASAAEKKVKIGMMLPATGNFARYGTGITNGFKFHIAEHGGKIGGMEIEYVVVDDASDKTKAAELVNQLINKDKVDIIVGSVHSDVAAIMAKEVRNKNVLLLVPHSGSNEITGKLCAPNIFRLSYTSWQVGYATGAVLARAHKRTVTTLAWAYVAGVEHSEGFKEAYLKGNGKILKEFTLPFTGDPNIDFQPILAEVAALKPDAFYVFLPGNSAWKFMKDYAASGLKGKVPIYGNWITDNTIEVPGSVAEDTLTVLHYGDDLPVKKNNLFREAYKRAYNVEPDVYNVEGYDTAELLDIGLSAVKGDVSKKDQMIQAMESAKLDSPRGPMRLSKAHHPIQDFYLRKVQGNKNTVIATAVQQLSDPGRGCAVMDDKK